MIERECETCGERYHPRVEGQRFCSLWCRQQMKAAEGRMARWAWRKLGRPMMGEEDNSRVNDFEPPMIEEPSEAYRRFSK
jgi:hypothetical protein